METLFSDAYWELKLAIAFVILVICFIKWWLKEIP